MAIHPGVAGRFPLLDGIGSLQEAMSDPEKDRRVRPHGFLDLSASLGTVDDVLALMARTVAHAPVPQEI